MKPGEFEPDAQEFRRAVVMFPKTLAKVIGWLLFIIGIGGATFVSMLYADVQKIKERQSERTTNQAVLGTKVESLEKQVDTGFNEIKQELREINKTLQQINRSNHGGTGSGRRFAPPSP